MVEHLKAVGIHRTYHPDTTGDLRGQKKRFSVDIKKCFKNRKISIDCQMVT